MSKPLDKQAKPYLDRIESILDDIATLQGEFMSACKAHREDIKEIIAEAHEKGIDKKALRGLVKWRELARKQEKIADDLNDHVDSLAQYELLIDQLGPLGFAAAKAAGAVKASDDDADVRSRQQKQTEKERADADALEKVGRGAAAPVH